MANRVRSTRSLKELNLLGAGKKIRLIGSKEFIVLFLRSGQMKIVLCENEHRCMPRTYADSIRENHLEAIHSLIEQGIEPQEEDVQLAREKGLGELAELLSNQINLEGFELVKDPS